MYSLRIENDRGEVRRIDVDSDAWSVGRAEDNDLVLDEANISRRHFRLESRKDGVFLVDNGSTFGVRLNGESVGSEALLQQGDVFSAGDFRFEVCIPDRDLQEESGSGTQSMRCMSDIVPPADETDDEPSEDNPDENASGRQSHVPEDVGVPFTLAVSEDESLKILLEMERVAAGAPGVEPKKVVPEDLDEDLLNLVIGSEQRKSSTRILAVIGMILVTALLAWVVYTLVAGSDTALGLAEPAGGSPVASLVSAIPRFISA